MMKQEQFAGMRARLMEQLQQGVEWSDEAILERIDQLEPAAGEPERGDPERTVLFGAKTGYFAGTAG